MSTRPALDKLTMLPSLPQLTPKDGWWLACPQKLGEPGGVLASYNGRVTETPDNRGHSSE